MAKLEKRYPPFECVEYDYGHISRRDYDSPMYLTIKFADNIDLYVYFYFKDFLDFHKRKKTAFYRTIEHLLTQISGWGSRHFELVERLQVNPAIDLFQLFAEYIEEVEEELAEQYEEKRYSLEEIKRQNLLNRSNDQNHSENLKRKKNTLPEPEEEITTQDEDEDDSPYDRDRQKLQELLEQASNDMYEALKVNFFPQMAYFQRRYPTKWKNFNQNIEETLQNFEDHLLDAMLPALDDEEYQEFDIKYNSQKADMSDEDEPPAAR